jgi:hypothetical protein
MRSRPQLSSSSHCQRRMGGKSCEPADPMNGTGKTVECLVEAGRRPVGQFTLQDTQMPFGFSIQAVAKEGQPGWRIGEPDWLLRGERPSALKDYLREVSDGSYRDRFVLITRDELADWHRATVKHAYEGMDGARAYVAEKIDKMESMLAAGQQIHTPVYFMVLWDEWESGLGD